MNKLNNLNVTVILSKSPKSIAGHTNALAGCVFKTSAIDTV